MLALIIILPIAMIVFALIYSSRGEKISKGFYEDRDEPFYYDEDDGIPYYSKRGKKDTPHTSSYHDSSYPDIGSNLYDEDYDYENDREFFGEDNDYL